MLSQDSLFSYGAEVFSFAPNGLGGDPAVVAANVLMGFAAST
jgi:hypothetical protein